jgi:integrase
MGVFERDKGSGEWWVRYTGADGKIHREKVGTKSLAKQIYLKRKNQVREEHFLGPKQSSVAFRAAMDKYVERRRKVWRSPRLWVYCARLWNERFGTCDLRAISRNDIERAIERRSTEVSPASVNRELTLLKTFFTDCLAQKLVIENPARFVRKLRENNVRVRALSEAEETRLMLALPAKYRTLIQFTLMTGLRRGEVLGLRWNDVDLGTRTITIRDPKEGDTKRLPLSQAAAQLLSNLARSGERVFPYNDRNFNRRVFVRALRRAGVTDFRFHDLRHTFATRLAMRGVDLYTIARLMGHHSIRMTERYAHLTDEALRGAVERLGSFRGEVAPELALAGRGSEKVVDAAGLEPATPCM